ncbi:MAG: hypothetical protein KJZ85_00920 [Rhodobacteraceae bacterium]|jgi:hypothetical protein|nr:hypothetical protein [Paracoccaceae bacterium]
MIRTIALGDYISVQGIFVGRLPDGRICVRVGNNVFTGPPVSAPSGESARPAGA